MIWIIGGTKDSRILLEKLVKYTSDILVSITTQYGKKLILEYGVKVLDKKLSKEAKKELIKNHNITTIIDTSHPYAQNISNTMIETAKECGIEYLRFERPSLKYESAKKFEKIESLVEYLNSSYESGKVLSTLGSKNLKDFINLNCLDNLIIRVLPISNSLQHAEELGFLAKNIVAMQGPFSKVFNKAIIENYNIKYLLTKESGEEGGELEKIQAAHECKVEVLVLERPKVNYPKVVNKIEDAMKFLKGKEIIKELF